MSGTLTVRKLSDECVATLKQAAKDNNRSMEAQIRSVLEEFTATYAAHQIASHVDFITELRALLDGEGLDPDETLAPARGEYDADARPMDMG